MKYIILVCTMLLVPQVVFALPNDPRVEQWGYAVTKVYDAWDITTGSDQVVVAVIDNGFDHYHADLIDNVWNNEDEIPRNGIDDDNNGYIDDIVGWNFVPEDTNNNGTFDTDELIGNNNPRPAVDNLAGDSLNIIHHGTLVAGIIGAKGNNGLHGAGLNWDVSLMNLKIVGNDGNGSLAQLARAIRYAVDNGADVISMSVIGGLTPDDSKSVTEAIQYAYEHDVVLVAAAGNNATNLNDMPMYPVCSDAGVATTTVIGTTAVMEGRRFAVFSNYGSDCIDITAPGHEIASTLRYAPNSGLGLAYDSGYQGTSFAVPFISGTAALIRSIRPDLSAPLIIESILNTTSKTPPEDEALYASLFGRGLIQVADAIAYAKALPVQEQKTARTITHSGVQYSFDDNGTLVEHAVRSLQHTANVRTQVSIDTEGALTAVVDGRQYRWSLNTPENIQSVFIDPTARTVRIVVVREMQVDWYTVDGWLIRTIHTRGVLDANYAIEGLKTLETKVSGGIELVQYNKSGGIVSRTPVPVPGSGVHASFVDASAGYLVTAQANASDRLYNIYMFDTAGRGTRLFSYTPGTAIGGVYIIPGTEFVVVFEKTVGTVYTTAGTWITSFSLE